MQHGYKTQHTTVTALQTLNNTVAKGFNQMAPPARTITVALDMSKAFDTINIHTLIINCYRQSLQAQSLSSSQTTSRDAKPTQRIKITQRQFKIGVPKGDVLSPTIFNIYTSYLPPSSAPARVHAYADYITITATHTSMSAAKKYIQPYLHKVFAWTKQNNLLLNPDTTTCTLFTPDPAEYTSTTHGNVPKGSGSYLRPTTHIQHTYSQHLSTSRNTSTNNKSTHCNRMG